MDLSPKRRIITLDLLRGYFLWVILVDHIYRFPGFFEIFTGKGLLWASAADGFFLESGVLVGYLRGRETRTGNFGLAWKRLWLRALVLYAWSIGLTLLFTLLAYWLPNYVGIKSGFADDLSTLQLLWQTLTFQYSYGWTDFLPYYTMYMVFAPLALWLMNKRQTWLVLFTSLIIWLFRGHNPFLAWQALFFIGLTGGYYFPEWEQFWHRLSLTAQRWVRWSSVSLALVILVTNLWIKHFYGYEGGWLTHWFDKWTLAPGHLIVGIIWFIGLYLLVRGIEPIVAKITGWLLLPAGRNSLATYIFESFVVVGVNLLLPYPSTSFWVNTAINLSAITVVWLFTYFYDRRRTARRLTSSPIAT
ncbi:MAG: OpgC domain-containing protein [Patescibacteria group bacterium]|jgi:hypothetical protein